MSAGTYNYLAKTIILGDTTVGKSSILQQFINKKFSASYDVTIGIEFGSKLINIINDGKTEVVKMQIWDTAGHERYRSITRSYYRDSAIVFLVYDVTNRLSFDSLSRWIEDINIYVNINDAHKPVIVILGNKIDLENMRCVTTMEGEKFATEHNILFCEVSAKNGINIDEIFNKAIRNAYNIISPYKPYIIKLDEDNDLRDYDKQFCGCC